LMKPWVAVALASFALAYLILGPLKAVSILVVACPSAFVITSAFTTAYSIAALAGKGVVVKGGSVLEKAAEADTIVLDKTGTITVIGLLEVSRVKPPAGLGEEEFKVIIASLAAASAHPISKALTQISKSRVSVEDVVEMPGRGVKGFIDGLEVIMGNREIMLDHGIQAPGECGEEEITVYIAVNGATGRICLRESIDPATSSALKMEGYKLVIASGDKERRVKTVAKALQIENYHSNMSPEDKIALVRNLKAKGSKVIVVGDGVNDIAAMAAADVGVAVSNIDAVISVADSVLLNGVKQLPLLLGTSKTYIKTLKIALATPVIIKAIALTGGLTGAIPLWLVALLGDDGATIAGLLASTASLALSGQRILKI
ncbi:MAG: HAD-IC family P-type ATPase, partial [Acidilobaceae archaeon]